jgi:predicted AAA+ superfamily ATPase
MFGENWVKELNSQLHQPDRKPDPDDLAFLLKGMEATWNGFFREVFGKAERAYVVLLRDARNEWAHNKKFSSDETNRILDFCEVLLNTFQAKAQVDEVQALRKGLQRQVIDEEARSAGRKAAREATRGEPQAGLSPWREVVTPHPDVAQGRFEQAEFAADLYQVLTGRADQEYQDPVQFYARTFITEGLRDLLRIAGSRLSGQGGDPVVELQTSFGGGKTHSLIALYHLVSGIPTEQLAGVAELLADGEISIPESVNRAVFVGQMMSPSTVHEKEDGTKVHTVWGELAWQLGGADAYALVADDDVNATSPGANLIKLFESYGPALILIDEWVAYARLLPDRADDAKLPAGDFDTQFTFAQTLTEAAAAVENTLVLVSIPSSELEVGGEKGQRALEKLKHVVSRKAAHWQPTSTDESFEIVRRRLFEPIPADMAPARDAVVKAFHNLYLDNAADFPAEAKEADYRRRMEAAYPLHPELFDRLYQDWSTLDRFQRTRGMLKMMATVIAELWQRDDRSLLIMPGNIPIDSPSVIPQLTRYLDDVWEPIIRTDVDGPNSIPFQIDQQLPNLGRYSAARRVARTTYLGTAPRTEDKRGVDLKRIVLGCAQPGEKPGVFQDALRHVASRATYLYNDSAQYWYDTKPTLARLAADRAESNYSDDDADIEIRKRVQAQRDRASFTTVHVFPDGPGDVPDEDDGVRLVVLPPAAAHKSNGDESEAVRQARVILDQRQGGPRINRNLLVFLAADANLVSDLRRAVRSLLAWQSILNESGAEGLNLTAAEVAQVNTRIREAEETVIQQVGEAFQHVITPKQAPGSAEVTWQGTRATGREDLAVKTSRKLESSEDLIPSYGGIRVRMDLDRPEAVLWDGDHIGVRKLWGYYCQYLYMPRLANFGVLAAAVSDGAARISWDPETFAFAEAHDLATGAYQGLTAGNHVVVGLSQSAVIVKPDPARFAMEQAGVVEHEQPEPEGEAADDGVARLPTRFYGRKELDPVRSTRDFSDLVSEVASHLQRAGSSKVTITVEIEATSDGFDDRVRRTVSENANQLGFETHEFEG